MERKSIVVFASGSGTTFSAILEYSHRKDSSFDVTSLVSDRMKSGAVSIARNNGVEIIEYNSETPWILKKKKPDLIVLAGFLKIIEPSLLETFPDRIVNIHPSLLPSFGGKGFYGIKWCRENGIIKLNLEVFSSNENAISLYKKLGFTIEGQRKGQFLVENTYVDDILMTIYPMEHKE